MLKDEEIKRLYSEAYSAIGIRMEFYRATAATPFLVLNEYDIEQEAFELTDSLFGEETDVAYGYCAAAEISMTVRGAGAVMKNAEVVVKHVIDGQEVPLGRYVVHSIGRERLKGYRDITAYDQMVKFDIDVLDWYNALTFPLSLRAFRASLCKHIGVLENVPEYLPNDELQVEKTIEASELLGREVLQACEEVNGCFGHFDRYGVLQHIVLKPTSGLYPGINILPGPGLYPGAENKETDITIDGVYCRDLYYENYIVKALDKVQIRYESRETGCTYGNGSNCYVVEGNFILFGKDDQELRSVAENLYGLIANRSYTPYDCTITGAPYVELGDRAQLLDGEETYTTYVFKRTLSGLVALKDKFQATGNELREQNNAVNKEVSILKNKTLYIVKTVDEVSTKMEDVEKNTRSIFKQVSDEISQEVKRAKESEGKISLKADGLVTQISNLEKNTSTRFEQTDKSIGLKVDISGVISSINLSKESVKIDASKINLNGITEFTTTGSDEKITVANGKITFYRPDNGEAVASVSSVYKSASSTVRGLALYGEPGGAYISVGKMNTNGTFSYYYQVSLNTSSGTYNVHSFIGGVHMLNTLQVDKSTTVNGPLYVNDNTIGLRVNGTDVSLEGHKHSYLYNGDMNRYIRFYGTQLIPNESNRVQLGSSTARYNYIYLGNQPDVSSDRRQKDNITPIRAEVAKAMVMSVEPQSYTLKDDPTGQLQTGFIAQDVETAALACGLDNYAGYSKHATADKDCVYGLKYEALEAFMWSMLRDHENRMRKAGI